MKITNYISAIEFIEGFIDYEKQRDNIQYNTQNFHIENFRLFLEKLGNPQNAYKTIHVAGSKGKGSTAALLHSILTEGGVTCGLYSSPHLSSYCERVRINRNPVTEDFFAEAMEEVRECYQQYGLDSENDYRTTFELLTAAAFVAFRNAGVKYAVIETGLGGRLDATNILQPALTLITKIGYDHQAILGETIEQIAAEKCGIIKQAIPVILSAQSKEDAIPVMKVVGRFCLEKKAPFQLAEHTLPIKFRGMTGPHAIEKIINALNREGAPVSPEIKQEHFFESPGRSQLVILQSPTTEQRMFLELPLLGEHQAENLQTAMAAMRQLRRDDIELNELFKDDPALIQQGIRNVNWPGRFEVIHENPAVILDGAHCETSFAALAKTLQEFSGNKSLNIIIGLMREKTATEVLQSLLAIFPNATIFSVALDSPRAKSVDELYDEMSAAFPGAKILKEESLQQALAKTTLDSNQTTVVCGSLYHLEPARRIVEKLFANDPA